jgi:hypothetical protein
MNLPLRCACGAVQGQLVRSASATRAVCYCRDCQAYARFLGSPGIVDRDGGTEVVASLPMHVRFTRGVDSIACMSLSERGLLRWYASCCDTPIGNTPRNPKIPYVGVVHCCVEGGAPAIDRALGRKRIVVNTKSARKHVRSTPLASSVAVLKLMAAAAGARMSGAYRNNPFFVHASRTPIRPVRVLSDAERARVYGA